MRSAPVAGRTGQGPAAARPHDLGHHRRRGRRGAQRGLCAPQERRSRPRHPGARAPRGRGPGPIDRPGAGRRPHHRTGGRRAGRAPAFLRPGAGPPAGARRQPKAPRAARTALSPPAAIFHARVSPQALQDELRGGAETPCWTCARPAAMRAAICCMPRPRRCGAWSCWPTAWCRAAAPHRAGGRRRDAGPSGRGQAGAPGMDRYRRARGRHRWLGARRPRTVLGDQCAQQGIR